MRPLINFQLLLAGTLDQHRQSARIVACNDVVDAVADHDQWQLLSRLRMRTRSACIDAPCFGDVQDAGRRGLGRAEVAGDDGVEGGDV